MAEKKLLLLETNFDVAKKYEDFLKESVWKIEHRDSLNSFLASMKENEFDVAVVEGGIVPDKIISMVLVSKPVIVCSDNKPDIEKITTIPRHFSGSELVNALGKVSFMKVTGKNEPEKEAVYSIEETIGGEKPVLLEPVFDEEEEAELLTPEEGEEPVRSSWEIPNGNEDVDVEAETLMEEEREVPVETFEEEKKKDTEKKEDIFEKIDEIDSIIMSINKDVVEKEEAVEKPVEKKELEPSEPFAKDDKSADFLFDDDYKYEEENEPEIGEVSDEEDVNSSRVSAFESILNDEDAKLEDENNQIDMKKAEESEVETIKEYGEPQEEPSVAEPEPVVEPESAVEAEPEKVEEKQSVDAGAEGDVLKAEFRKWLDENARSIIKEVVEEQLKELYGKK